MFLNQIAHLNKSLVFRLTIWYTIIFALSSFAFLSIFYFRIQAITTERNDKELIEEISEFVRFTEDSDVPSAIEELIMEIELESAEEMFFCLLDIDGREIKKYNLKSWGNIDIPASIHETLKGNKYIFETLTIP